MIDLYYAPTPNGWKVTILLEELKAAGKSIPFKLIPVNLAKGDQHKPEFLKISPNGRMPAIVDHDNVDQNGNPLTIFESAAIMMYLDEISGGLFYANNSTQERFTQLQWLFWVQGGLGPMAGQTSHFINYASHIAPEMDHSYALNRYNEEYKRLLSVMDIELRERNFLGSTSFALADMAAFPWVIPYKRFNVNLADDFPNVKRWFDAIKKRPGTIAGVNYLKSKIVVGGENMSKEAKERLFGRQKL